MTKTMTEALVAILVEKLGGKVEITQEDLRRADELEVTRWDNPAKLSYTLTAARPPEVLVGEIVTPEPQAIEPPACQHPFERQYWTFEGDLLCGPCGAVVGHDEQMRIRSIGTKVKYVDPQGWNAAVIVEPPGFKPTGFPPRPLIKRQTAG